MTTSTSGVRTSMRGGAGIAVAMGVMNVASYAYTIAAARLLGPRSYGAFAAFMGLLLVVAVLQLGLQATGARRIAADPDDVGEIEHAVLRVTYRTALALSALCLVLTPLIDRLLRLDSLVTAALIALTALPMTVMGGQAGILQGERRWRPLALLYIAAGVPRFLLGTALLLWSPTERMAIIGVTVSFLAPCLVGWLTLRHSVGRRGTSDAGTHGTRSIFWETARNSHALLAYFALSNVDVIVARTVLDAHESGLYAGGIILSKAVLFLPQFVVVVAFPSMSTASERRKALVTSVTLVLGLSALAALATWALSGLALVFIGGSQYADIQSSLWRFALLGGILATLQLLVYSVVARQHRWAVYLIWAGLLAVLVGAQGVATFTQMVDLVLAVDAVLLVALLGLSFWRTSVDSPVPPAPHHVE